MNKNLENLMYESGLTAQGCWDSFDQYDKEAIERFALLLVRECSKIAEDYTFEFCGEPSCRTWDHIDKHIRQYFGEEM